MYLGPKFASLVQNFNNINSDGTGSERGSSQEEQLKCDDCKKVFYNQKKLTRHRKQVHKAKKLEKVVYKCEKCEKEYTVSHPFKGNIRCLNY